MGCVIADKPPVYGKLTREEEAAAVGSFQSEASEREQAVPRLCDGGDSLTAVRVTGAMT